MFQFLPHKKKHTHTYTHARTHTHTRLHTHIYTCADVLFTISNYRCSYPKTLVLIPSLAPFPVQFAASYPLPGPYSELFISPFNPIVIHIPNPISISTFSHITSHITSPIISPHPRAIASAIPNPIVCNTLKS